MEEEYGEFKLVLHEILGQFLAVKSPVRDMLLRAYASQKYSLLRNILFIANGTISRFRITTNRHLINRVVVTFETTLQKKTLGINIHDHASKKIIEKECRRYIKASHPLLVKNLGCSCNDLSNMNFLTRALEIHFDKYRLIIHKDWYTIQYKVPVKMERIFVKDILTLEALYTSSEGPIYKNPVFLSVDENCSRVIGVASFLECMNLSVKTIYYEKDDVILYQRVCVDNYTKPQYFILEKEVVETKLNSSSSWKIFFDLSFSLEAKALVFDDDSKYKANVPIHSLNNYQDVRVPFELPKLDGIPAALKFYPNHFVLTNDLVSFSFQHTIKPRTFHVLRDYSFLVESDLYVSRLPYRTRGLPKPNPVSIIDLRSNIFNAEKRMEIIQELRKIFKDELYRYYIFFQGEILDDEREITTTQTTRSTSSQLLIHNKIYEVQLSSELSVEALMKIKRVIRRRDDKQKPNSRQLVKTVYALM